jgi:hypothetical protein
VAAAVQIVVSDLWSHRREQPSPLLPDASGG